VIGKEKIALKINKNSHFLFGILYIVELEKATNPLVLLLSNIPRGIL